tara:strand:+ start:295 stop:564 length:270 start_codon:yes stop_codon:yes gene_type:complete
MRGEPEYSYGNAPTAEHCGRGLGGMHLAKNKKGMVMVISLKPPGGKAPKKPTKTSEVDKGGMCGVKKASPKCPDCEKSKQECMAKGGCV